MIHLFIFFLNNCPFFDSHPFRRVRIERVSSYFGVGLDWGLPFLHLFDCNHCEVDQEFVCLHEGLGQTYPLALAALIRWG